MIGAINGFNANANFDFSGASGQNLKAREEKEATNSASNLSLAQPNLTVQVDYDALDPDKLDRNQLKIWADKVDPDKLNGKNLSKWFGVKMGFEKVVDDWAQGARTKAGRARSRKEDIFAKRLYERR